MSYAQKIEALIQNSMDAILHRYQSDPAYPFIDTKLDLMTGKDFSSDDAWYKQKEVVYCWIQGRGMEALARHISYFRSRNDLKRANALKKMLREVTSHMEKCRRKNKGRLFFMMDTQGNFLKMDQQGNPEK